MADIKKVLTLLCKQIILSTGIELTPNYFRLAKYNKQNNDLMKSFWSVLNVLSHCVVSSINPELNFPQYGEIKSTKIYFAYLGYDAMDFYGSTESYSSSRALLIAFSWLIASHDCLKTIVHKELMKSIFGHESIKSSYLTDKDEEIIDDVSPTNFSSEINLLIHKCSRINNNLKEINELMKEKACLITKIHDASLNKNGLPHLNVAELFLLKKLFIKQKNNKNTLREECEDGFEELHNIGVLLEIYTKWIRVEDIFFNWMETILDDTRNDQIHLSSENNDELSTIICIVRHLTKKKIHKMKLSNNELVTEKISSVSKLLCPSRFLRVHKNSSTDNNDELILQHLSEINNNVDKKVAKLNSELKLIIKSIPNCLQV
ncbi:hypothetical protein PV325_009010 [Microctonus aethiopoides]|uniref:Tubulin epsilon and delta complex protein 1 domain-containing protein n=2 Tax=Microctonus aethiopoides TaxID=144406 RepID=A0AA39C8I0_9HYME|nr:hypothetical protein PV325_009010 [Microctonus aethiopoides]KAK0159877.1 hypothetical protein PV328_007346 [Microctonus aethiopoides]